jgi:hypothetical protein
VGTQRTAWHFYLSILLRKRCPSWVEVHDEVTISDERPRLDYLLLRKIPAVAPEDRGRTLRGFWPHLGRWTIVEFKSIGRPYRRGDLDRLWGYLHQYYTSLHADERVRPAHRDELRAALVVPARSPALSADVDAMRLQWEDLGAGYWRLEGGLFPLYVVEIDIVAEQEDDKLLRLFGHNAERSLEAGLFWAELVGTEEAGMSVQDLEGYEEVMEKMLAGLPPERRLRIVKLTPEQRLAGLAPEQRLAGLAPEQRLAGLDPEQRLAGLDPEQAILALPDEILRGFSEEYLRTLSEPTRIAIRKRLGR